jgi:arylsulfatase A
MKPSEVTMAEALHEGGYRSACIGKWHNGEQYPFTPMGQGFDEAFGFNNGHWNNYFDPVLLRGSKPEPTRGYITDVLTDEAMQFITANQAKPFFCYLSYNAPHSPFQVPDRYFDKFKAKNVLRLMLRFRDYHLAIVMIEHLNLKQYISMVYDDWC